MLARLTEYLSRCTQNKIWEKITDMVPFKVPSLRSFFSPLVSSLPYSSPGSVGKPADHVAICRTESIDDAIDTPSLTVRNIGMVSHLTQLFPMPFHSVLICIPNDYYTLRNVPLTRIKSLMRSLPILRPSLISAQYRLCKNDDVHHSKPEGLQFRTTPAVSDLVSQSVLRILPLVNCYKDFKLSRCGALLTTRPFHLVS